MEDTFMANPIDRLQLRRCAVALTLFLALAAATAAADQIVLKNGDRITGTIDSEDLGKLVIVSPIAGKITVNLKDVRTFSTDAPITIKLDDGSILNQRISEGPDGQINAAPAGVLTAQPIPLTRIEKINPPPVVWTGAVVVSGMLAQANTTSEQFGASFDASRRSDFDRTSAGAAYLYGSQKVNGVDTTNEDNWYIKADYNYFFVPKFYAYANVRVEKDRINLLDLRLTPGIGAGYQIIERPDFNANLEAGISWVYEEYSNVPTASENVSARVAYHIDKTLFDSRLKLFSDCAYLPSVQDVNNYLVLFDAGLHLAITKSMFSELKTEVDYDSHPAPTARRTSTKYILGAGWTF
jgi:putative salt-induced outer membrane protein YdiY